MPNWEPSLFEIEQKQIQQRLKHNNPKSSGKSNHYRLDARINAGPKRYRKLREIAPYTRRLAVGFLTKGEWQIRGGTQLSFLGV